MPSAPLASAALAYLAGLLFGEAARFFPLTVFSLLFLLVPLLFFAGRTSPRRLFFLFLVLLVGFSIRQFSLVLPEDDLSKWFDRGRVRVTGKVRGFPKHDPEKTRFRLGAVSVYDPAADRWASASGLLSVSLWDTDQEILPGDLLEFEAELRPPRGYWDPGVFDWGSRLRRLGVHALAGLSSSKGLIRRGAEESLLRGVEKSRNRIGQAIVNSTDGDSRALLLSLVIGEEGYLTPALREIFMASGTTHILSISGSHLGLIALVAFGLFRALIRRLPAPLLLRLSVYLTPSQVAAPLTLFPVLFYALLAGAEVATVRSLIMIVVYLAAVVLGRESTPLNSLALAALITMVWDPAAPLDLSFQLSYLSVLAICAVSALWPKREGEERSRWGRIVDRLNFAALTTIAVTLATVPLTLYYFHRISWSGLLANWVVVPVAGFVIVPLGLTTSLIALLTGAAALPLAFVQSGIIDLWVKVVSGFAHLPGSEVHLPSPPVLLMIVLYLAPLAGLMIRGRLRWFFFSFTWTPLLAWALFSSPSVSKPLQITFIDVGQGDAALVRFPGGERMLIDGGGSNGLDTGEAVLAPFFWQSRISGIDYVVATHPQLDHIGGLATILRRFPVGEVWTNGVRREIPFADEFEKELALRKIPVRVVRRNQKVAIGSCGVTILNPSEALPGGAEGKALNNGSTVLRVDCPGLFSALFTADVEAAAEGEIVRSGLALESDVLKVPHHGARGSVHPEFLAAVNPKVAVISVGSHNRYGHPTREALSAYARMGTAIYQTDLGGAIRVEGSASELSVRRFVDTFPEEVPLDRGAWRREWGNYRRLFETF
jgi:competence protein ComEC